MERNDEQQHSDVIDLGAIVEETKGKLVGINDHDNGLQAMFGLADD